PRNAEASVGAKLRGAPVDCPTELKSRIDCSERSNWLRGSSGDANAGAPLTKRCAHSDTCIESSANTNVHSEFEENRTVDNRGTDTFWSCGRVIQREWLQKERYASAPVQLP